MSHFLQQQVKLSFDQIIFEDHGFIVDSKNILNSKALLARTFKALNLLFGADFKKLNPTSLIIQWMLSSKVISNALLC